MDIKERFLSKVLPTAATGCWEWKASKWRGYGKFRIDRQVYYAHRVSYELHNGPIPEGLDVCHRCDNPSCVNPDHLFLGTHTENMADRDAKGRLPPSNGSRNANSKLVEADIIAIRSAVGVTQAELAAMYGVRQAHISDILSGKRWGHIPRCF